MKKLKDFEKDLNKCSKCALCQSVCPLYKLEQNECLVSKGKFVMLHGVTKGELPLSKTVNKYLDKCLKCGKCSAFCPSSIDACKIFNVAKSEYMQKTIWGKVLRFFYSKIFPNLIKIFACFSNPFRPSKQIIKNSISTVLYFKGCVNQMCPRTDWYLHKILKDTRIKVLSPDFDCCGLPFLSDGDMERFEHTYLKNSKIFKNVSHNCIVSDCASCTHTLKNYPQYFDGDLSEEQFKDWADIIDELNLSFKFPKPVKITFHKPCHLESDKSFENIISRCENVEYIKMQDYDNCCGMAGSFALKNFELSKKMSDVKAKNIIQTNADYVITTCPACVLGLKKALFGKPHKIKVVSLLEFLSKAKRV